MSVSPTQTVFTSTAGGGTVFNFGCRILAVGDLLVKVDDVLKTPGVDYLVSGVGNQSGGSVTFTIAPTPGAVVRMFRATQLRRDTDYATAGDFRADVVNPDFDRAIMALQDIQGGSVELLNSLRAPAGEQINLLPIASARANRVLAFDALGNPSAIVGVDANSAAALDISLRSAALSTAGAGQVGFSTAQAYGAGSLGKWLKDLTTGIGAGLIGFVQAGTGAVAGLIQDKLRERVSLFDYMTPAQIADVKSFTGAVDVTAACQAAFDSGADITMLPGAYLVSDKLTMQNGQVLQGKGRAVSYFKVTTSFNLSATSVLKLGTSEPGAQAYDVGFVFTQANQNVRANCTQYPYAIEMNNIPRAMVDRIRVSGGWNGIDARGNAGGAYIGFVELGCLNSGIDIDGALDFIHGGHWHFWVFGMGPALQTVFRDGNTKGLTVGACDGLNIDSISSFGAKVTLTSSASTAIPVHISKFQADGDYSRLVVQGGLITVGMMYSTKTAGATSPSVDVSAGTCLISSFNSSSGLSAYELHTSGTGLLWVKGGWMKNINANNGFGRADGGTLIVDNVYVSTNQITYTQPHFVQVTGSMKIRNCMWEPKGSGSGVSIRFNVDNADNASSGNDTSTWTPTNFAGPMGDYGANQDQLQSWTPTPAFASNGTFAPTYTVQAGFFRAVPGGYWIEFRLLFSTNAYSGASGSFRIDGLPVAKAGLDSTGFGISRFSAITLSAGNTQLVGYLALGGFAIVIAQCGSGIAATDLSVTNIPASRANIEIAFSGFIPTH